MKKIATFLFSLSLYFANAQSGEILLSDNFVDGSAWNVEQGDFIVSNNIVTTEGGNGDMTFAFRDLSRPLTNGDKLQLTFKSNQVTNFFNYRLGRCKFLYRWL
ncbi:MAG: hypothetical protein IPG89_06690 [Bacteroidetes bacterium]|nr:hypothetical protein [Bacteroidota bacterium]